MQLGTRWDAGAEPPTSLPPEVVAALRAVEAELSVGSPSDAAARPPRWTLTWLERRPVLDLDTGHRILLRSGAAVTLAPGADDAAEDEDDLF